MNIIIEMIGASEKKKILDIPAGSGKFADILRAAGHDVVAADINREMEQFVYADMSEALPFPDNTFDVVICMEGVEHVLNPFLLVGELARVCKVNGQVVITTPNIMNMFSRLQFLFTGIPYQFSPAEQPSGDIREKVDRGHISPLGFCQLRYLLEYFDCRVVSVAGDRYKKKALIPIYLMIVALGWFWGRRLFFSRGASKYASRNSEMFGQINSLPLLLSRSMILVAEKR